MRRYEFYLSHSVKVRRKLLWIDCTAGAVVGVAVLLLAGWLSKWYGLPRSFVLFMGVVNVVYTLYSFSLAVRKDRPKTLIRSLVIADLTWALMLLGWVIVFFRTASVLGLAYLITEALFVGGLAYLEWRSQELLRTA